MTTDMASQPIHPQFTSSHPTEARTQLPWRKNIVICCDGTGNDYSQPNPDGPKDKRNGYNSNVVKLYTTLVVDNQQVAYYHPGVGTMGAPTATHWITRQWSRIKGLAFGAGFRDNVLDAYRYLMEVYNDNGGNGNEDRVFIFGFSRGAYTARALAGLLHGYGLLCRGNEGHLPYAWRMYTEQHKTRTCDDGTLRKEILPNDTFRLTFSHTDFKIYFMGVWDTVSSVGWIYSPLELFNVATNPCIRHARHAVSIDEHRCFFMDNLYNDHQTETDLVQAWFPGVHSDVGGSYTQPQTGMAYEALTWMLAEAKDKGLVVDEKRELLVMGKGEGQLKYDRPISWELHRSLSGPWWIPEMVPHTYYNKEFKAEYMRVPLGLRLREVPDGALVHDSVWQRMNNPDLTPGAQHPYEPRNCRKEFLKPDPDGLRAKDGTPYWRYRPAKQKTSALLTWLDRHVVTGLFIVVELLLLISVFLFLAALLLDVLPMSLLRLGEFLWNTALPFLAHWVEQAWAFASHGFHHHA